MTRYAIQLRRAHPFLPGVLPGGPIHFVRLMDKGPRHRLFFILSRSLSNLPVSDLDRVCICLRRKLLRLLDLGTKV